MVLQAPPAIRGRPPLRDFDPNSESAKRDLLYNVLDTRSLIFALGHNDVGTAEQVMSYVGHCVTSIVIDSSMPAIASHLQENTRVDGNQNISDVLTAVRDIADRLERLDRKVDGLDRKVEERMERLERKVDGLDRKVEGLDRKVDRLATDLESLKPHVWKLSTEWAQDKNVTDPHQLRPVPFRDGTWPSDHNLPELLNKENVLNLEFGQLLEYARGYGEDIPIRRTRSGQLLQESRGDLEKAVLRGIGVDRVLTHQS